ncbi:MAG TPA: inositol monophosphatase family protein [Pyrinomonadaceae bacterium]|nr:inositol monophosphatase family protein [Pyrinomonadaceae bacterium]
MSADQQQTKTRDADDELSKLLDFAVEMARGAGEITTRYFRRAVGTYTKENGTLVTDADLEAEKFLRRAVAEKFPADAIIGEEEGERQGTSGRRWIFDPIDGTYSFVHGLPLYGVLIGLEIDDEPALGVIHIPALDETAYAARGLGCFYNGTPARVSQTGTLADSLILSTDFHSCERYGFGAAADELQRRACARRTWGDCYGYLLVATGRAEVMLDPVMNLWDCAALLPVIEEAGGRFTDWQGRRTIRGGNAVATNGALYEEVFEIINTHTHQNP